MKVMAVYNVMSFIVVIVTPSRCPNYTDPVAMPVVVLPPLAAAWRDADAFSPNVLRPFETLLPRKILQETNGTARLPAPYPVLEP